MSGYFYLSLTISHDVCLSSCVYAGFFHSLPLCFSDSFFYLSLPMSLSLSLSLNLFVSLSVCLSTSTYRCLSPPDVCPSSCVHVRFFSYCFSLPQFTSLFLYYAISIYLYLCPSLSISLSLCHALSICHSLSPPLYVFF
jgi:hypothetical protein